MASPEAVGVQPLSSDRPLETPAGATNNAPLAEQPGSDKEPMSVVVIGGTGAVGRCLVGVLLREKDKFGKVTVVGRRKVETVDEHYGINLQEEEQSGRLVQVEQDMDAADDESIQRICTGTQAFFCCLGTTRKAAGSAERFHQIDHGIPLKYAKAAKAVGVAHYSLVSSVGAKATSFLLYLRTKGELEVAVTNLKFPFLTILRPGLLDRGVQNRRFGEKMIMLIFKAMPVDTVAQAMAIDAYEKYSQLRPEGAEESTNVLTLDNSGINRTVQNQGTCTRRTDTMGSSVDPPSPPTQPPASDDKPKEATEEREDSVETTDKQQPSTKEVPQSTEDSQQPTEEIQQPTEESQSPIEEVQQSTEDSQQPIEEIQQPTEDSQQPTEDSQQPTEEIQQPTEEIQQPTEEIQQPTEESQQPTEEVPQSTEDSQQPTEDSQQPTEEIQQPTEEEKGPDEDIQQPEDHQPGTGDKEEQPGDGEESAIETKEE